MTDTTALVPSIPASLAAQVSEETYIQILTRGDFASIYGTSKEAAFLFWHALKRGLDPWRRPYQFLKAPEGKVVLYAGKEAARQYKHRDNLITVLRYRGALRLEYTYVVDSEEGVILVPSKFDLSVYEVEVDVVNAEGKVIETEIGTSELGATTGRERKDAVMKAITRAKNRALLAAAGESSNDESEFDAAAPRPAPRSEAPLRREPRPEPSAVIPATVYGSQGEVIDTKTGEIIVPARNSLLQASQSVERASSATSVTPSGDGRGVASAGPRKVQPSTPPIQGGK